MDRAQLAEVVKRLNRVQGQLGGVVRMIEEGRDCAEVVTQLAAASRALDRAGFKIISMGLKQCMEQEDQDARHIDEAALEKLFLSLA